VGIALSGWTRNAAKFNALAVAVQQATKEERWVGTTTFYAKVWEFGGPKGTQHPRPSFRPALRTAAQKWNKGSLFRGKKTFTAVIDVGRDSILDPIADAAVENARTNVRRQFQRRTGRLEDGWAKGKTVEELVRNSKANQ
jgi:hypothetical protein